MTDRLIETGFPVNDVSVGEKSQDPTKYKNIKVENYWLSTEWQKARKDRAVMNHIVSAEQWIEMSWIKYKVSTDKVLQIEPK